MENLVANALVQLGAIGILVLVLITLLWRYEKRAAMIHSDHIKERESWRKQASSQHEDMVKIARDSNIILTEIKTLILTT